MARLDLTPIEAATHLRDAGFRSWQVVVMGQIAMAESALNAYAVNVVISAGPAFQSLDVGLCQINTHWASSYYHGLSTLLTPATNAMVAFHIFTDRGGLQYPPDGYKAWNTYPGKLAPWRKQAVDAARAIGQWP